MERRIFYSFAGSAFFHAALFAAYLRFVLFAPQNKVTVISDVDLLMPEKAKPVEVRVRNKTLDFLKLAMPKIIMPKPAVIPLDIKPLREKKILALPEKLVERSGRLKTPEKLDMDMKRTAPSSLADMAAEFKTERAQVAMAPRIELEEVGMKKAPAIPEGLKFDERAPVVRPQSIQEVADVISRARKAIAMPATLLLEETQTRPVPSRIAGEELPGKPAALVQAEIPATLEKEGLEPLLDSRLPLRRSFLQEEEKKPVEIEGPLSGRKVLKAYTPAFPEWGREKGILEASVSIKFFVDSSGKVMENMTVERTSGYGALDRLAMDALKKWLFAPLSGLPQKQWGVITFRFVTE
ncbi:MAG: TonB family protein [bacterium]